ncbi:GNAT family N-acetyltransferase [Pseudorhodobacter sp. E13]|uniref:GNAT family N-acetyltransferase n=1 Tax=Pseudorhodobacter sp. E13 TaxID=2487931 RepID=UPI000F8ECCF9|nr:GNAT family N-acetyltransferase [Pseudorhodobacter sp. E13]RUS58680.1 GNAT family N-acetyltransferase [Pseudorhodobacter sp. E13]
MTPAALAALHAAAFTTPRPWTEAEFASLLAGSGVFLLGDARGFVLGRAVAGEAEVLTLATAPDHRRQGIARHLMDGFATQARSRGADSAFLEVAEDNAPATALYLSLGYNLAGRRKAYFETPEGRRVDALVLTKSLAPPA